MPKPEPTEKAPSPRPRRKPSAPKSTEPRKPPAHNPAMDPAPSAAAKSNGHGKPGAEPAQDDVMHRAEDMLDETGVKLGHMVASLGIRLRRLAAVAREEAEDLWAEAQSVRRGDMK